MRSCVYSTSALLQLCKCRIYRAGAGEGQCWWKVQRCQHIQSRKLNLFGRLSLSHGPTCSKTFLGHLQKLCPIEVQ